jgi:DNA-binding response OmpR family regulator
LFEHLWVEAKSSGTSTVIGSCEIALLPAPVAAIICVRSIAISDATQTPFVLEWAKEAFLRITEMKFPMRILIVEDHPNVLNYLKQSLSEQGYAVDLARTGLEALDWTEVVEYDLVVLDIMLPEVNGLTVCRRLRARGYPASILILTARDTVDDRVTGLDAGADDYLVKPFALKEFLARARALTRRRSIRSSTLKVADLSLDTNTHVVMRDNVLIKLTAKEYAVLECLMRESGRVLSRMEIAESIWNYDVYNQSNVVDVYIRNLRRKIDGPFDQKLIHTVRGVGYSVSDQPKDECDT